MGREGSRENSFVNEEADVFIPFQDGDQGQLKKRATMAEYTLPEHFARPLDNAPGPSAPDFVEMTNPVATATLSEPIPQVIAQPINTQLRPPPRIIQNIQARQLESMRRQQSGTDRGGIDQSVIDQINQMPIYRPWFTYFTAIIQIVVLALSMIPYTGGTVGPWGFSFEIKSKEVTLFDGSTENQELVVPHNLWYGPETKTLLHFGVKYTPCMRQEDDITDTMESFSRDESDYGCCINLGGKCGMMDFGNCTAVPGAFTAGKRCSEIPACDNKIIIRPCCFGSLGDCRILTEDHCDFIQGYFHKDAELCSDVNCMEDVCGVNGFKHPNKPDQWWRLISAMFMHIGVAHLVFNLMFQLRIMKEIETFAGPWRTAIMYMVSGIGGNVIASIFSPLSMSAGSSGALYGMIGVMTVDLFQSWQLIPDKLFQLVRLIAMLVIVLGIGTLPWIDNWAHAGGFFVGVIGAIGFLPYIYFGKWDERRKFVLRILSILLLIAAGIVGVTVMYKAPDPDFCSWCKYVDCVPYTKNLCKETA